MTRAIEIYDTTLRDGAQMQGISFSIDDKLKILKILDELGVAFVEGGWPGANPKDVNFFDEAKKIELKNTKLVAFGSTRKANSKVEEDTILAALLRAETEVICIVGKSSAKQIETTLRTSLENNLLMLSESVEFLKSKGKRVLVDAEHFFDGYEENPEYSKKFIEAAIAGGAETVVLCDTNGGTLPENIYRITKECVELYGSKIKFGIHAHNDSDLAVANSIRAVRAGAIQVQGTINGYGERCGNANLVSIISNLELKYKEDQLKCLPEGYLEQLTHVSKTVAEIANMNHDDYQPFVGMSAFTHKGGLHASAMKRDRTSYEHVNPSLIGNVTKFLVSEQAGVSNIMHWIESKNLSLGADEAEVKENAQKVLQRMKELEHEGYSFENADASFELLIKDVMGSKKKYFELIENNAYISNGEKTEATVRIRLGKEEIHAASLGNGPANALDSALRRALEKYYPEINNFKLKDFKVRIASGHLGTAAKTIVQVNTSDKHKNWDTIGVSPNIVKASWDAIVDSIEYGLTTQGVKPVIK